MCVNGYSSLVYSSKHCSPTSLIQDRTIRAGLPRVYHQSPFRSVCPSIVQYSNYNEIAKLQSQSTRDLRTYRTGNLWDALAMLSPSFACSTDGTGTPLEVIASAQPWSNTKDGTLASSIYSAWVCYTISTMKAQDFCKISHVSIVSMWIKQSLSYERITGKWWYVLEHTVCTAMEQLIAYLKSVLENIYALPLTDSNLLL